MRPVPHINEGRGSFKEIVDRKLLTRLDPASKRSAELGGKRVEGSFLPDLDDANQAPDITE